MSREGRPRWDIGSKLVIGRDESPMIVRYRLLQTPLFGIYVHRIHREDLDRDMHDHPWSFFTVVLRGGYDELYAPYPHVHPEWRRRVRRWKRWSWHRMSRATAHRIIAVLPDTVTFVVVGPRRGSWGFFTPGWVDYREYARTGEWSGR